MKRVSALVTPPKLTGQVRQFCVSLTPAAEPMAVKVVPFPGLPPEFPDEALKAHIKGFGGEVAPGWRIRLWPGVMMEAAPHQVWLSPKGELIDVIRADDGASQILFLPDAEAGPDIRRAALVADPLVARWLDLAATADEASDELLDAYLAVVRKYAKPNDPCFCGSGRQLRKCHPFR